jgi:recombination protein RecA
MAVKKAIQNVARAIAGQPGPYVIPTQLHHRAPVTHVDTLSTGLRPLDKTLGIGGLPCGKITELIGPGKIPLSDGVHCVAAKIGANVQRKQQWVTIIDMVHNFDPWQARRCGLMAPQLLLTRPDTVFSALTTLESSARDKGLIVINMGSVANLFNHAEPELLRTLLRRLHTIIRQSESVFLFITHLVNENPFSAGNYPAGFPLAELADIRLWAQNETLTYNGSWATTYKANLTVIKNRLAMPGIGADIRIKLAGF